MPTSGSSVGGVFVVVLLRRHTAAYPTIHFYTLKTEKERERESERKDVEEEKKKTRFVFLFSFSVPL